MSYGYENDSIVLITINLCRLFENFLKHANFVEMLACKPTVNSGKILIILERVWNCEIAKFEDL